MYRRNNPLKIGKGYQEQDLLTLRVKLTVARVEYCERDKNYFSCSTICTYIHWWYIYSCWKKWTNLDDLSPVLLATFNRFDVYETLREKCFPRIDVFFRTHEFSHPREQDVHNGTRRCFTKSFCLWIIIKLLLKIIIIDLDWKARDLYIRRSPLLSLYG